MTTAAPFTARQCQECGKWIVCWEGEEDEEGDPLENGADFKHYEKEHPEKVDDATPEHLKAEGVTTTMIPYCPWNEREVEIDG